MFDQLVQDSFVALPVLGWGILALLVVVYQIILPRKPQPALAIVAAGLVVLLVYDFVAMDGGKPVDLYSGSMIWDGLGQMFTIIARFIVLAMVLALVPGSFMGTKIFKNSYEHIPEFLICLLFSGMGVSVLATATDLTALFLGLEILSIALYCLCGFFRTNIRSTESAMKYLLIGAFSTAIFLYGVAFLYGASGATQYVEIVKHLDQSGPLLVYAILFLMAGFAFKLALVPFHLYTADVYDGAPTLVTGYLATIVKVGVLAAALRLFWGVLGSASGTWVNLWIGLSVVSIIAGNLAALAQTNIKKLLAFSSVSHAGFMGLALIVANPNGGTTFPLMSYIVIYSAMSIGLFALLAYLENPEVPMKLEDLKGLGRKRTVLALLMGIFIFGLAGIPPFAGFMIKFWVFQKLIEQHYLSAAIFAVAGSLIGAGYYLKLLMYIFISEEDGVASYATLPRDPTFSLRLVVYAGAIMTLLGGLRPQFYADWILSTLALK